MTLITSRKKLGNENFKKSNDKFLSTNFDSREALSNDSYNSISVRKVHFVNQYFKLKQKISRSH